MGTRRAYHAGRAGGVCRHACPQESPRRCAVPCVALQKQPKPACSRCLRVLRRWGTRPTLAETIVRSAEPARRARTAQVRRCVAPYAVGSADRHVRYTVRSSSVLQALEITRCIPSAVDGMVLAYWSGNAEDLMQPSTRPQEEELLRTRNRSVARSFYRQLRTEGFTHQQIIELSTTLLDFVTDDLREQVEATAK